MTRTLFDILDRSAADMLSVHSVGGTVLWASSSTADLFGWSPEALVGTEIGDLAHPDDRDRVRAFYARRAHDGDAVRFRLRLPDGSHRWVESRVGESRDDGVTRLVSITRDIYLRPRAEERPPAPPDMRPEEPAPGPPTVLVVDDQAEMRELLRTMLKHKYRVVEAEDGEEALRMLDREPVLAVVSDVIMPGMTGDQLLRAVRSDPERAHIPILLVTARTDRTFRTRALRDGATDLVTKPFDRAELLARIDNLVLSSATFRSLRQQTRIDSLTGVFNRARVLHVLEKQCELAVAGGYALSVVMIDVDHFKRINDTYGHAVGDEVLHEVARRLQEGVRSVDAVGRYGGEEFLVILPSCDYAQAMTLAEAAAARVRGEAFGTAAGPIRVTISGGVATRRDGCTSPRELVEAADRALYRAKRAGRDRIAA